MSTQVTNGVKVSVDTVYQEEHSKPIRGEFLFAYKITIENNSDFAVKLLRRHWYIQDSGGSKREIKGEGVVGQQPVIEPGEQHQYFSGCNIKTEIGKMYGSYLMQREPDGSTFYVNIPEFRLMAPFKMN